MVAAAAAYIGSSRTARSILNAIFRRPRETSVILRTGKSIVSGTPTSEEVLRALEILLAERERNESAHKSATATTEDPQGKQKSAKADGTQAAAGGETDE
jgi:hypothetical protein